MNQLTIHDVQKLNRFVTNERLSYSINHLTLDILWLSYPECYKKSDLIARPHPTMHSHSFCETHFCTSGSFCYQLDDGREFTIHEGDAILIPENIRHILLKSEPDANKLSMAYRLTCDGDLYNRSSNDRFIDVTILRQFEKALSLYQKISDEVYERKLGFRETIGTLLFEIAIAYERLLTSIYSSDTEVKRIDRRADEIVQFVQAHISENITTLNISEAMHQSKRQINRIMLKEFGVSCTELISQEKHKKAQELLLYSDEGLSHIANMLGFSSVFSFSRFFKRQEGMSPSVFRKSHYSY